MIADSTTRLTLLEAPSDEPLVLSDAKQFLRIDHTADDAVITRAIAAARQAAEEYLRALLLPQTYRFETTQVMHVLSLPVGPGQEIAQINAYNEEGDATTVDETTYRLALDGYSVVFHTLPCGERFAVEFTGGMAADAASVPALIKQGILHHVAVLVENRGATAPMPVQSLQCYQPFRRVRL